MSFFADVVAAHSGPDFVERRWLEEAVQAALDRPGSRYVLLTGEPGAGKTAFLARLAARHPGWPRYFAGHAYAPGLAVASFLRSVGRQLAHQHPELFEPEPVELDARRRVDPQLAHRALFAPAEALAARHPQTLIVVLADADSASGGLLDWLEHGPELPPNVRLVLASRRRPVLERFRRERANQVVEVPIDPRSASVHGDLFAYSRRAVTGLPAELAAALAERAEGNFAYLVAYRRSLTEAIARGDHEFRDRLLTPRDLPFGLDRLYTWFMASVRDDIAALGELDVRDPAPGQDATCPAWEAVGRPVLGVLAVARDALSLDQVIRLSRVRVWRRDVATVVGRLRQFLDTSGPRMRLFHASLGEFLGSAQTRQHHPEWAVEEEVWHERIALSYRASAPSWRKVAWSSVDRYGLRHVATHLSRCRRPVADGIVDLVTPGLRRALVAAFGRGTGDRSFVAVADLAADYAVRELPPPKALPAVLFLGAVGRDAVKTSADIPPAVAGVMARLGRLDEALERLTLLPPSIQRFRGLHEVLTNAPEERGEELRELLVAAALAIPPKDRSLRPRREALRETAVALARHDLRRALRLCTMAADDTVSRAAGRSPATDAVYRATGDESMVDRLCAGRASALLNVADRESRSVDRLARIEAELSTEDAATRLVCHARLAAHWRWLDGARASHHAEAVRSAAVTVRVDGDTETRTGWLTAIVDAADALAPADPDAARWLLDRFDGMLVDEVSQRPTLAAAALWARWGDVARSEFLLAQLLEATHGAEVAFAGQIAEVAAVVALFDREVALRLAEETFRRIRPSLGDDTPRTAVAREHSLRTMAEALVTFAPEQAGAAARLLTTREWTPGLSNGRATVLAELAAAALDAGREPDAKALLEESLASVGTVSTVDQLDVAPDAPFVLAAGAPPRRAFSAVDPSLAGILDVHRRWRERCARRLLLGPAEVLHAMLPPPHADGSPYTWDRTLRTMLETAARDGLGGVLPLVDRIADANERAVALAGVAAVSDPETGARLRDTALATFEAAPRFTWRADVAAVHPSLALGYLRPDLRARLELAIRGLDTGTFTEPFLRTAAWAIAACAKSQALISGSAGAARAAGSAGSTASTASAGSAGSAIGWHRRTAAIVASWQPSPVSNLPESDDVILAGPTLARLVAGERIFHPRGEWGGAPIPVAETPYDAVADLLCDRAGLPIDGRLTDRFHELLAAGTPLRAAELATLANDPALVAEAVAAVRGIANQSARSLGLARCSTVDSALVDEVLADLRIDLPQTRPAADAAPAELNEVERSEVLAALFPTLVTHRPQEATRVLLDAVRLRWREAMALLESAAEPLVKLWGVEVIEAFDDAVTRARAFGD